MLALVIGIALGHVLVEVELQERVVLRVPRAFL